MAPVTTDDPYYRICDLVVPLTPVRLFLESVQGDVQGFLNFGRKGRREFMAVAKGGARELPEQPTLWRPPADELWPYPLPERTAVLSRPGQMVSQSGRRGRRHDDETRLQEMRDHKERLQAAAAEAAARDAARAGQWWRDPAAMTYSPPGEISRDEAEGRIMRAILTDGMRLFGLSIATRATAMRSNSSLAAMAADAISSEHEPEGDPRVPFTSTPRDESDHEIAMDWFVRLAPPALARKGQGGGISHQQWLLVHRAKDPPLSWSKIAELLGRNIEWSRNGYDRTIDRVHAIANGGTGYDYVRIIDPREALRRQTSLRRATEAARS